MDGTIWFGTRRRVDFYDGKSFKSLNLGFDLSQQTINTITEDHLVNVWLGSRGNGVYKIHNDGQYTYLDISDGLPENSINKIFQDSKGKCGLAHMVEVLPD